jgi:hypothetical protein
MQFLFYQMLSGRRELMPVYMFTVFALEVTAFAYSISLILPGASRQIWLKRGGMFLLPVSLVMLILTALHVLADDVVLKVNSQKWLGFVGLLPSMLPFFLLFEFSWRAQHAAKDSQTRNGVGGLTAGLAMVGFSFALMFGVTLVLDARTHLYWQGKNAEATAKFVAMGEERSLVSSRGEEFKYLLIKPANYNPDRNIHWLSRFPMEDMRLRLRSFLRRVPIDTSTRPFFSFRFVRKELAGAGSPTIPQ